MKIGFAQTDPVLGRVKLNVDEAVELVASIDADLIVLPELFSTGYDFTEPSQVLPLAEASDGPTIGRFIRLCKQQSNYVCGGFAEKTDRGVYNSAFLAGPSGLAGIYRKTHLFAREKELFLPGDTGFKVFDIGEAKVGMMVCFDWFFPESARTLALNGADIILHPANLVLPYCPDAMITRCLENKVFAVTSDRVGYDDGPDGKTFFIGTSQIVSPRGEILGRASTSKVESGVADIDPSLARNKAIGKRNDLFGDRRPEMYER